jgi:hypothetical protein
LLHNVTIARSLGLDGHSTFGLRSNGNSRLSAAGE